MRTEREILDARATLVTQARAIHEAAEAENFRALTTEESANYDAVFADIAKLDAELTRVRSLATLGDLQAGAHEPQRPEGAGTGQRQSPEAEAEARGWSGFLRSGRVPAGRALQADPDTQGGYLSATQQFVNNLIRRIDDLTFVRQWATVLPPLQRAASLGMPYLNANPDDADWTGELATGSEDGAMSFGKRELFPHPLAKRVKISNRLIALVPDVDALAIDRMGYKFGITWEKAGLLGNGNNRPLGVFVNSVNGISSARDVSTGNLTTAPTFDGLKAAKYSIKAGYWPRLRWLFHRDCIKILATLKDGDGQYLWAESVRVGEPDTLAGLPVFASEYVPNTFTTGQYVGILGDWKTGYQIVDSLEYSVQRLGELYAETNQVGYIGRWESDGMPVLEEAFARVKLA